MSKKRVTMTSRSKSLNEKAMNLAKWVQNLLAYFEKASEEEFERFEAAIPLVRAALFPRPTRTP